MGSDAQWKSRLSVRKPTFMFLVQKTPSIYKLEKANFIATLEIAQPVRLRELLPLFVLKGVERACEQAPRHALLLISHGNAENITES